MKKTWEEIEEIELYLENMAEEEFRYRILKACGDNPQKPHSMIVNEIFEAIKNGKK